MYICLSICIRFLDFILNSLLASYETYWFLKTWDTTVHSLRTPGPKIHPSDPNPGDRYGVFSLQTKSPGNTCATFDTCWKMHRMLWSSHFSSSTSPRESGQTAPFSLTSFIFFSPSFLYVQINLSSSPLNPHHIAASFPFPLEPFLRIRCSLFRLVSYYHRRAANSYALVSFHVRPNYSPAP